jgi:hypothetical protein
MTHSADDIQSDFLFARPSFVEGVGRILDLGGSLNAYNRSNTEAEADARAVLGDWSAVGHDVHVALEQLDPEPDASR